MLYLASTSEDQEDAENEVNKEECVEDQDAISKYRVLFAGIGYVNEKCSSIGQPPHSCLCLFIKPDKFWMLSAQRSRIDMMKTKRLQTLFSGTVLSHPTDWVILNR